MLDKNEGKEEKTVFIDEFMGTTLGVCVVILGSARTVWFKSGGHTHMPHENIHHNVLATVKQWGLTF